MYHRSNVTDCIKSLRSASPTPTIHSPRCNALQHHGFYLPHHFYRLQCHAPRHVQPPVKISTSPPPFVPFEQHVKQYQEGTSKDHEAEQCRKQSTQCAASEDNCKHSKDVSTPLSKQSISDTGAPVEELLQHSTAIVSAEADELAPWLGDDQYASHTGPHQRASSRKYHSRTSEPGSLWAHGFLRSAVYRRRFRYGLRHSHQHAFNNVRAVTYRS